MGGTGSSLVHIDLNSSERLVHIPRYHCRKFDIDTQGDGDRSACWFDDESFAGGDIFG